MRSPEERAKEILRRVNERLAQEAPDAQFRPDAPAIMALLTVIAEELNILDARLRSEAICCRNRIRYQDVGPTGRPHRRSKDEGWCHPSCIVCSEVGEP